MPRVAILGPKGAGTTDFLTRCATGVRLAGFHSLSEQTVNVEEAVSKETVSLRMTDSKTEHDREKPEAYILTYDTTDPDGIKKLRESLGGDLGFKVLRDSGKPVILVGCKADAQEAVGLQQEVEQLKKELPITEVHKTSAVSGSGITGFLQGVARIVLDNMPKFGPSRASRNEIRALRDPTREPILNGLEKYIARIQGLKDLGEMDKGLNIDTEHRTYSREVNFEFAKALYTQMTNEPGKEINLEALREQAFATVDKNYRQTHGGKEPPGRRSVNSRDLNEVLETLVKSRHMASVPLKAPEGKRITDDITPSHYKLS